MNKILVFCFLLFYSSSFCFAETIFVKYRSTPVDISNGYFEELALKPSSLVTRIIYDKKNSYLLVQLGNTFYHYCSIPEAVVSSWINASSLGEYYNSRVKGSYDCRIYPVPQY